MSPSVDDYIDAAKARLNLASDRALDRYLGFKSTSVGFWRRRKALPSEPMMMALAAASGSDPALALIDLQIWKAEARRDMGTSSVFQMIRARLALLPGEMAKSPGNSR